MEEGYYLTKEEQKMFQKTIEKMSIPTGLNINSLLKGATLKETHYDEWTCSECGCRLKDEIVWMVDKDIHFCPHCGRSVRLEDGSVLESAR